VWISCLLVAPLIFAGACSDDDVQAIIDEFTPPQGLLDQVDCLMDGLDDVGWPFDALFDGVVPAIDGEDLMPPESADHDCETGTFFAELDRVFEDGVLDVFLDGTTTEIGATDLCDGLDVTEAFRADWTVDFGPKSAPLGDGSGSFTIEWTSARVVTINPGIATIDRVDGCRFQITAIDITIDPEDDESEPVGTVDISVNSGMLTGTLTFDGTPIVAVSLRYSGTTYNFRINLDTGEPIFD
jgi:hypothetical protein